MLKFSFNYRLIEKQNISQRVRDYLYLDIMSSMKKTKNPSVFLDVSVDGDTAERIIIEVVSLFNTHPRHGWNK